ncbi:g-patch domain-containing protein [Phthorimaea operculella]|nr:g-patch domain-containing protein [Phthorimaea operculella]
MAAEMPHNKYTNFVRPSSPNEAKFYTLRQNLNGVEAKRIYLEEVNDVGDPEPVTQEERCDKKIVKRKRELPAGYDLSTLSDKDLFNAAQNNDADILKLILDKSPDKINTLDSYGWSLLMIACQANSIEAVKELLSRQDINTSVRDKAGNSAQSLVIKNKNLVLADLLLAHKKTKSIETLQQDQEQTKVKLKETFSCDICNKTYSDKQEHLSSTIHNINASKGRTIPAHYVIPSSNKGYQLMLKEGWDRESGLGPDGSGKRYPIRTVQKKDRKGLGQDKNKPIITEIEKIKKLTKKGREREHRYQRRMEAKFRREFY